MISTGKAQDRCTADIDRKTCDSPSAIEEASSLCVVLVEEHQPDSTTCPEMRPKDIASVASTVNSAGIECTMQELPVPRTLQAFFWCFSSMMRYVPESTQIKTLNAAKLTICDHLCEVMVNVSAPQGMEVKYAQPVTAMHEQAPQGRDK